MIKNLKIQNYALLKDVSIDFHDGFTVVSGETGAGKSIMLDALSLLLGKRVDRFSKDKNSVKTIIEAIFYINNSKSFFFKDNNLDFQNTTIVRREISSDGRSRAFINDTPVLINILAEFSNNFIEVYAQHQSVLIKENYAQFFLLDKLAGSDSILQKYKIEWEKYNKLIADLTQIKKSGIISDSELDFLQYQLEELETSNIIIGEKESIEDQISILENIEGIKDVISHSKEFLNNENGIISQLSIIKRKLLEFDSFSKIHERIESVVIELNDISADLNFFNKDAQLNTNDLSNLNSRLDIINSLLQKHKKKSVDELNDFKNEIERKINISKSFDGELTNKKNQINNQFKILEDQVLILNTKRNKAIPSLIIDIEKHLCNLGMPFARFMISFEESNSFHELGNTKIIFSFSANKGSPLLELSKVASGGELSRLMLSIKYILSKFSDLDTLIFDEIDTGVSGEIASLMGEMMQNISKDTQLIAISHLPQIASKAEEHLKVVKSVLNNSTSSNVIKLDDEGRVEEIAKLLSGKIITSAAFDNARALLHQ